MPADFHIDTERGMVFSKATGVFSCSDVLDHMARLLSHPDFRPIYNQLLDFRGITKVDLSSDEVRELGQRTIFSPQSRRAFVVASDLQFGLARMFGIYRELEGEEGIKICREMKEALSWLSLSTEPDFKLFTPPLAPADEI
jgi:hypothetical protein